MWLYLIDNLNLTETLSRSYVHSRNAFYICAAITFKFLNGLQVTTWGLCLVKPYLNQISFLKSVNKIILNVTGFERTRLPRTQQEDTLFTITR